MCFVLRASRAKQARCRRSLCRAIRLDVPSYDAQPSDPQPVGRRLYQKERLDSRSSQQGLSRMPEVGPSVASQSAEYAIRNELDRKSTRLNSSHTVISYAVFCLKKKRPDASQDHGQCE